MAAWAAYPLKGGLQMIRAWQDHLPCQALVGPAEQEAAAVHTYSAKSV